MSRQKLKHQKKSDSLFPYRKSEIACKHFKAGSLRRTR
ncbi:hypothetical protein CKA32_002194 [Geitlerinema sp. FC II]|nr:hypothetical protein CKA32_002194 [Geitlerinema sp. FC II]